MATADKLVYLDETKDLLRDAINASGGALTELDPFRDYVDPILWGWLVLAYGGLDLDYINDRYRIFDPTYNALVEKPWADIVNNYSAPAGRTYWDDAGDLITAGTDELILAFDPVTNAAKGNQKWGSHSNLAGYNRNLTAWTRGGGVAVEVASGQGIDGGNCTRATLTGASSRQIYFNLASPLPAGPATITVLTKYETWSGSFQLAYYDGGTSLNSVTDDSAVLFTRPDGWVKRAFTFTVTAAATSPSLRLLGFDNGGTIGDSCLIDFPSIRVGDNKRQPEIATPSSASVTIAAESQIIDSTVFADMWNAGAGTLFIECEGAIDAVALKAAGVEVVVDSASNKKYAVAYTSDPSATSLIIGANLNGFIRRIVYFRKELPASLIARLIA
ncbi:hypothetical protein [Pseudomonas abyssi]|uniref:Uncharacterized protein n=1 Tax=Pseudomonas abyssi TaxID=170540 RepID=A0A395RAC5_9PSED|nr:hypothetical protein [Halopseudomonas gallaeciensis]RGP57084.1 hypothetical protein ASB58_07065 [Halopseudomonas gallaeciensis]